MAYTSIILHIALVPTVVSNPHFILVHLVCNNWWRQSNVETFCLSFIL